MSDVAMADAPPVPAPAPLLLSPRASVAGFYDYYDPMRPIFDRAVSSMELLRYESGETRVKFQARPAHGDYFLTTDGAGGARELTTNFTGKLDIANAEFRKLHLRPFRDELNPNNIAFWYCFGYRAVHMNRRPGPVNITPGNPPVHP